MLTRLPKSLVFIAALLPLAWWAGRVAFGDVGANPIEATNRFLGDWALRFLLLALAITPLRRWLGWRDGARFRRMIGLFAFFYVSLHISSYVILDQFFDWTEIFKDIVKRTYITVGMVCYVALILLAVTSTNAMVKRLGGKRWRRLHKLVYLAGVLGVFHYFMMIKADLREPALYAIVLAVLLGARLRWGMLRPSLKQGPQ